MSFTKLRATAAGSWMGLLAIPALIANPARPDPHSWCSTSKPTGNAGALLSSDLLHAGHGAPGAPQPQALGPCQGRSGCALQTHRQPSQRLQGCLIWLAIVLAIMVNDTLIIGTGFLFVLQNPDSHKSYRFYLDARSRSTLSVTPRATATCPLTIDLPEENWVRFAKNRVTCLAPA